MKQWKDGEKFSAIDYTSERNVIKDTIVEKEIESNFKDRELFILNDTKPLTDFIDTIWMDSKLSLNKLPGILQLYIDSLSSSTASLSFEKNYEVAIASVVTLQADYEISGIPIEILIESDGSAIAEIFQIQPESIELDITHNVITTAGMQQDLQRSVPFEITSTIITTAGIQFDLSESVIDAVNSSVITTAGAQQDVNEDIPTEINATVILSGDAQLDIEESVIQTINGSVGLVGNAQTDTDASIEEVLESDIVVTGFMDTVVELPIEIAIINGVTIVGDFSFDIEALIPEQIFNSNIEISAGQAFDIISDSPEISITNVVSISGVQNITVTSVYPIETITGSAEADGLQGEPVFLLQARSFGASAPITRTFSDTGTSQVYLPTGVTVTLREDTPNNTEITLTAPLTVNDGGGTWNFEKWRYNSSGFEVPAEVSNTTFETVDNNEIYEVYYTLPSTANWQIVPVQSFSSTFTVFSDNDTSDSAVIALVTAQYSPEDYSLNYVARVTIVNYDMEIIGTKYVKRF